MDKGEGSEIVVPLSPVPSFCGDTPCERDERAKICGRKHIFYFRKVAFRVLKYYMWNSKATCKAVKAME